jgi:hypothetical protein
VTDKIEVIEQHYEAKCDDKFNATCNANFHDEVSPGNKVASWCIARGNKMPDVALRRPLQGTHWLLGKRSEGGEEGKERGNVVF